MSYVEFSNLYKKYENNDGYSVEDFNLKIEKGEFIVFVGPSGCGKSTTLRMLAGLEEITDGEIKIEDKVINDVNPKDRGIAMVFQNYALYPHMNVYDNIAFALKVKKMPKDEISKKVQWASNILGLDEYLSKKPKDLSGGQRQRVALGRVIVKNPKVFLMDEPLSNLDAKLRVSMRNEIIKLHKRLNATTIYVTHDQVEAMTMADRIVIMNEGKIQQIGKPLDVYNEPENTFVASFIGSPQMNLIEGQIDGDKLFFEDDLNFTLSDGILKKLENKKDVIIGIRPEDFSTEPLVIKANLENTFKAKINGIERMGNENNVYINLLEDEIKLKVPKTVEVNIGDEIEFCIKIERAHFFDVQTKKRIF